MCGITALFYNQPRPDAPAVIQKMTDCLSHRGPDADGTFVDHRVALGHRRLSILDLSPEGQQPMWDASGRYAIVYNGEVYNYRELKAELPTYPYRSGSDTEVLLAGFAAWGTDLFKRLNGIFAFALYDRETGIGYIVRDRFGIKPLYYAAKDGLLAVASEHRALLASGLVRKQIAHAPIVDYLWNGTVTGTQRLSIDVQQLAAGHYIEVAPRGQFQVKPFYIFYQPNPVILDEPRDTVLKGVRQRLLKAVESQLMSDVPLGAFLSGGIDSSAIVALMSEVSTERPLTFTIGFEEKRYDETEYANLVAQQYNTRHTVLTLTPEQFLQELPAALDAMDTVTLDGINSYVVSKLTRQAGVTVALSGLGGDELFGGYPTFLRFFDWKKYPWWLLPQGIRRLLALPLSGWSTSSKRRRLGSLMQIPAYNIEHVYPTFRGVFDQKTIAQLSGSAHPEHNPLQAYLQEHAEIIHQYPLLSQYSIAEMTGYTQHMLLKDTDQMSMASGLEVRVPFFDNDLVDYVLRIPDALKYPHTPKQLLVDALEHRLPADIVQRPKMGFTLPWDTWLRGELRPFCEARIDALSDRGIINGQALQQMWRQFKEHRNGVLWSHVWMFVVFEHWLERNLD